MGFPPPTPIKTYLNTLEMQTFKRDAHWRGNAVVVHSCWSMCNEVLWDKGEVQGEAWAEKMRLVACWGLTLPDSFRSFDTTDWCLILIKCCFSVVTVCWDGVRLCLLLWKQSWLLEIWGGSQYWVQQRLLRGSHPALWWRWQDHPLWQWVCPVPITVENTGTFGPGEQACLPFLPSIYSFIYLALLTKHLLQVRHWPDPGDTALRKKSQPLPSGRENIHLTSN